jgi:beta-lactamase class A
LLIEFMEKRKRNLIIVWHVFFIGMTVFLAWLYVNNQGKQNEKYKEDAGKTSVVRQRGFHFINPILECEIEGEIALNKYIPFEKKTKKAIQEEIIDKNKDISVSVYFRNLNNGPWFGINEKEKFSPASLLKVPIMIAYLKEMEGNPELAKKELVFQKKKNEYDQTIISKERMEEGKTYSIENIIYRMIVNSDNDAMFLLLENISTDMLNQVNRDLGVATLDESEIGENFISVKDYASFFRILYNSAYLDRTMSEKALDLLSQTEYKDGIVSGTNGNVPVAHKFGERTINEGGVEKKQLHDCGIVYYEEYPYLLCIMTRGNDMQKLSSVIADTSRIIFEEIEKDFPEK